MFGFGTPLCQKRAAGLLLGCSLMLFAQLPTAGAGTVTLAWDPSPDTNVSGYNIYYGGASGSYTNKITELDVTNAVVSDLAEGATYFFAATAVDSSGDESDFSNEISYSVPTVPSTNSVLSVSNLSSRSYTGLFYESPVQMRSSGAFTLSTTARGQYSGVLKFGMAHYPFTGRFGAFCEATNIIQRRDANPLNLNFFLGDSNETDLVLGSISDGTWTASLFGERVGYYSKTNPAPEAGSYTLVIPGYSTSSNSVGNGFGTVRVNTTGIVRFAGDLADGTAFTQKSAVSETGDWPVYVPYSGIGLLTGWLTFTNEINNPLQGSLSWLKLPAAKAAFFSNGLATVCEVAGSPYEAVQSESFTPTNAILQAAAEGITNVSTNEIVDFHLAVASGVFRGSMADSLTGKPLIFKGVVLQNFDSGYGFILTTNQSFPVLIP